MSIEWSIDISGPCVTTCTCCCSVNPLSGRGGKGNEDEANPVGVIFFLAYLGGLSFFSFFILFFFFFSSESAYGRMPLLDLAFCGSGLRQQLVFVPIPAHDTMQDC